MNEFAWEILTLVVTWPLSYFIFRSNPIFASLLLARFFTEK